MKRRNRRRKQHERDALAAEMNNQKTLDELPKRWREAAKHLSEVLQFEGIGLTRADALSTSVTFDLIRKSGHWDKVLSEPID